MREQFPGYFVPSEAEFTKLWQECIFVFDANVLLDLYRSTAETREVLFSVLEKIADRIFLPHQAASEYLRNRLNSISGHSDQYKTIRKESENLANTVKSIVQEHAILNGQEIAKTAAEFASRICDLVDASAGKEPDLLESDDVLTRLADLFEGNTGQPYPVEKLKEIYAQGSQRYVQAIPPGYKDDKKGEPGKYGDLLIWFQLIDHAKTKEKPIVFVTADAKEDWVQQHRGNAVGPRPELRQEMMEKSGRPFWVYTTARFLEFAKRFLGLKFDTKKAESEFEKIEKQDREAAEQLTFVPLTAQDYSEMGNQPLSWGTQNFFSQPVRTGLSGFSESYPPWAPPEDAASKGRLFEMLPINGAVYSTSTGKWKCEITGWPESEISEPASYSLRFDHEDHSRPSRNLKLWASMAGLKKDVDWGYKRAISDLITRWLGGSQLYGEIRA